MVRRGIEFTEFCGPASDVPVSLQRFATGIQDGAELPEHAAIIGELAEGLTPEDVAAAGMGTGVLSYQTEEGRSTRLQNMVTSEEVGRAAGFIARVHEKIGGLPGIPIGVVSFGFPQAELPDSKKDIRGVIRYGTARARELTIPHLVPLRLYSAWLRTPVLEERGLDPWAMAEYVFWKSLEAADDSNIPRVLIAGRGSYEPTPALTTVEHVVSEKTLRRAGFRSYTEGGQTGVRVEGQYFKPPVEIRRRPRST